MVQSSSVTTGLAIVFTQQGLLSLENAVPLIMGANIGTTATAFIAVFNMDIAAKKTALSHFLFNVGGVLIFFPLLLLFGNALNQYDGDAAIALATIHLVFNLATSMVFIAFVNPFTRLVDWLMGEGKMDFVRLELPVYNEQHTFDDIRAALLNNETALLSFLQENYNSVTLSLETNYQGIFDAAEKRIQYIDFVQKEYLSYFSRVAVQVNDPNDSTQLIHLINRFDYLFQIHDSINDLFNTKKVMQEHFIELKSDILLNVRALSSHTLELFDNLAKSIDSHTDFDSKQEGKALQQHLDEVNRALLVLMANPERTDAGALTNFVTYSQRLKDKLINFAKLRAAQVAEAPDLTQQEQASVETPAT